MSHHDIASFLDGSSMRQDDCARLLLLLARSKLTDEQQGRVRKIAEKLSNWEEFAQLAAKKFIATYAYRHMNAAAADIIPPGSMALIRRAAYASTLSNLRTAASQLAFHKKCIASTGASHAYLKGFALATQCSQEIGDRSCRDIDVLVADHDFRSVLGAAMHSGYAVYIDLALAERARSPRDLDFLSRHAGVVTLVAPEGVHIEVHRRLDKESVDFNLDDALSTADKVQVAGVTMRTLSRAFHFNYICYHHARHFWSKLHWVVDIEAMTGTPNFDMPAVLRLADEIGIRPTIDAALEFFTLTSTSERWSEALAARNGGGQFLAACLFNLDGDLELEQSLRKGMPFNDFMSSWQIDSAQHSRFAKNARLTRLRPTPRQYLRHRLPRPLHWLYFLRNGASLAAKGFAGMAGRIFSSEDRSPKRDTQPKQS